MRVLAVIALGACGRIGFDSRGDGATGDATTRPDIVYTTNIVFVTAPDVSVGMLGSLANADAICQARAAGLPGTYVAWLSTSTTNAIDRLAGARGWVRPDGVPFADTTADIVAGRIYSPPAVTPDGITAPVAGGTAVATGTFATGSLNVNNANCSDLTAPAGSVAFGLRNSTTVSYTEDSVAALCSSGSRIYCFGTDRNVPLTLPAPVTGRRAFLSSLWSPSGGLAGADLQCQNDAAALGGTYRAFLATGASDASTRFSDGPPWVRLDGFALAPTAMDILAGIDLYPTVPINLDAFGTYRGGLDTLVWLGVSGGGSLTCQDWTSNASGRITYAGHADQALATWGGESFGCNMFARLICLEV